MDSRICQTSSASPPEPGVSQRTRIQCCNADSLILALPHFICYNTHKMKGANSHLLRPTLTQQLRSSLRSLPVLAGSLVKQFVVCGKPGCRCQRGQKHGPFNYLYWKEQGRSRSLYVPRGRVAEMRRQIQNYRGLRKELARRVRQGLRGWQRNLQEDRRP